MYINHTVFTAAPDPSTRSDNENKCFKVLDELGISYERLEHDAAMTIDNCQEIDQLLGTDMCKNLFLTNSAKSQYYLLLMPGNKQFRTKDVSRQIGSTRLSFGASDKMQEYLGVSPGSVTVMGLMFDTESNVRLLIDKELIKNEYICFHPCINTGSVKAKTADIVEKFLPYTKHAPTYVEL